MKITLENTDAVTEFDGIKCRIWEGTTETGVPVVAFIPRIAVPEGRPAEDYSAFEFQLCEKRKPTIASPKDFVDARLVL